MAVFDLVAGMVVAVVLDSASWGANCVITDMMTFQRKRSTHLEVEKGTAGLNERYISVRMMSVVGAISEKCRRNRWTRLTPKRSREPQRPDEQIWGGGLPEKQLAWSRNSAEKLGIQSATRTHPSADRPQSARLPRSYIKTVP